jgi:hypothetical protein
MNATYVRSKPDRVFRILALTGTVVVSVAAVLIASYLVELTAASPGSMHHRPAASLHRLTQPALSSSPASLDGWTLLSCDEFQIQFPNPPVVNQGKIQTTCRAVDLNQVSYNLSVINYLHADQRDLPDETRLQQMCDSLILRNNYELRSMQPLHRQDFQGRQVVFQVKDQPQVDVWLMFLTKDRFYAAAVIGHQDPGHADIQTFLDSLQVSSR